MRGPDCTWLCVPDVCIQPYHYRLTVHLGACRLVSVAARHNQRFPAGAGRRFLHRDRDYQVAAFDLYLHFLPSLVPVSRRLLSVGALVQISVFLHAVKPIASQNDMVYNFDPHYFAGLL